MKTGIFYGSTMGITEVVAKKIGEELDAEVFNVADGLDKISSFDLILLGSSTLGFGDLQDDWVAAIDTLKESNLNDKKVAVFGTGDAVCYPDTFVDALAFLAEAAKEAGADIIGKVSKDGYEFSTSRALEGEELIGLAVDENNQADMTDDRILDWVTKLKREF